MKHLALSRPAQLVRVRPGDGTVYTLMIDLTEWDDKQPPWVAVGAGDCIEGGYVVPPEGLAWFVNETLNELRRQLGTDTLHMVTHLLNHEFVNYWCEHANIRNRWTAVVALLTTWIVHTQPWPRWDACVGAIGDIYYGNYEHALEVLELEE